MSEPPCTPPPPAQSGPATESSPRGKHAFVTVGSTRFDALVHALQTDAVLAALHKRGISSLTVQGGEAVKEFSPEQLQAITASGSQYEIDVEAWAYKPTLQEDYERADLVISHAGTTFCVHSGRASIQANQTSRLRHHPRRSPAKETAHRRTQFIPTRQSSTGVGRCARRPRPPEDLHH